MTLRDLRGAPLSHAAPASLARYERALDLALGYRADPVAEIDAALAMDPDFVMGHVLRGTLFALAAERGALPALEQSIAGAAACASTANARERGHIAALIAWRDGDWPRAMRLWGDVLAEHPRDSLALLALHIGDFFLGWSPMLRDHVARVLPYWDAGVPGYGYVLGMQAFGLEECGEYARAEEIGRRALDINPRDGWAVHAVTHVMEMQGRPDDGIVWLTGRREDWAQANLFAFHNWWHLALFRLELGDHGGALALHHEAIVPRANGPALELVDSSALLWRLRLRGVDVGASWDAVADAWDRLGEDGHYAFNDVHAMMAYVGAGRSAAQRRVLAALEERAAGRGINAAMTREVGLPMCRALEAMGRANWAQATDLLLDVRPVAQRGGGSHAQRDVVALTLHAAALAAGRVGLARAIAAERSVARPESPLAKLLTAATIPARAIAA